MWHKNNAGLSIFYEKQTQNSCGGARCKHSTKQPSKYLLLRYRWKIPILPMSSNQCVLLKLYCLIPSISWNCIKTKRASQITDYRKKIVYILFISVGVVLKKEMWNTLKNQVIFNSTWNSFNIQRSIHCYYTTNKNIKKCGNAVPTHSRPAPPHPCLYVSIYVYEFAQKRLPAGDGQTYACNCRSSRPFFFTTEFFHSK